MNLDVCYSPAHDRLKLCVRNAEHRMDWWISRRLLLAWVDAWLRQLENVDLPCIEGVSLQRDLGVEHRLSLEFDGPVAGELAHQVGATVACQQAWMLEEVTLTVQPTGCTVILKTTEQQQLFELTRRESHAVLEMLAGKARAAGWLEAPDWPQWLGVLS